MGFNSAFKGLRLFMTTTNLFVIANVKQLRTDGSFRILLPFFRTSWGVGVLNSAIFNNFHNRVEFGTILEGLRNFGGGGVLNPPNYPLDTPLSLSFAKERVKRRLTFASLSASNTSPANNGLIGLACTRSAVSKA